MWYVYMRPQQTLGVFTGQRACKVTALDPKPYTPNLQVSLHNYEPISVLAKPVNFFSHMHAHTKHARAHRKHEHTNTK